MTLTGPPLSGYQVSQPQSQQGGLDTSRSPPPWTWTWLLPVDVAPPGEETDKEVLSEPLLYTRIPLPLLLAGAGILTALASLCPCCLPVLGS